MTILPSPSPSLVPDERAMPGADRHAVVCVYQTNRDREVGELLLVELGGGFVVDVGHVCTPVMGPATAPATERTSGHRNSHQGRCGKFSRLYVGESAV
jgi:hypothetical protein